MGVEEHCLPRYVEDPTVAAEHAGRSAQRHGDVRYGSNRGLAPIRLMGQQRTTAEAVETTALHDVRASAHAADGIAPQNAMYPSVQTGRLAPNRYY